MFPHKKPQQKEKKFKGQEERERRSRLLILNLSDGELYGPGKED